MVRKPHYEKATIISIFYQFICRFEFPAETPPPVGTALLLYFLFIRLYYKPVFLTSSRNNNNNLFVLYPFCRQGHMFVCVSRISLWEHKGLSSILWNIDYFYSHFITFSACAYHTPLAAFVPLYSEIGSTVVTIFPKRALRDLVEKTISQDAPRSTWLCIMLLSRHAHSHGYHIR